MQSDIRRLDANHIKLIAILAMTVDHIAWTVFPGNATGFLPIAMHIIGRLTCPIMCYFIAEGYHYTKNIHKYTARLFAFAFISHFAYIFYSADFVDWKSFIPFYYGNFLNQTSVMWSLAWGLVMLRMMNSQKINRNSIKIILIFLICALNIPSDWSFIASLCVLALGTSYGNFKLQMRRLIFMTLYATAYCVLIGGWYGLLQLAMVLCVPILMLYNGKRGKTPQVNRVMKWLFYIYYPLHLFVIGLIRHLCLNP